MAQASPEPLAVLPQHWDFNATIPSLTMDLSTPASAPSLQPPVQTWAWVSSSSYLCHSGTLEPASSFHLALNCAAAVQSRTLLSCDALFVSPKPVPFPQIIESQRSLCVPLTGPWPVYIFFFHVLWPILCCPWTGPNACSGVSPGLGPQVSLTAVTASCWAPRVGFGVGETVSKV